MGAQLNLTEYQQAAIVSGFYYGYTPLQVLGGAAAQVFGSKLAWMCVLGGSGVVFASLPTLFSWSFTAGWSAVFIMGVFQSPWVPAMSVLWTRWLPKGPEASRSRSIMSLGSRFGTCMPYSVQCQQVPACTCARAPRPSFAASVPLGYTARFCAARARPCIRNAERGAKRKSCSCKTILQTIAAAARWTCFGCSDVSKVEKHWGDLLRSTTLAKCVQVGANRAAYCTLTATCICLRRPAFAVSIIVLVAVQFLFVCLQAVLLQTHLYR